MRVALITSAFICAFAVQSGAADFGSGQAGFVQSIEQKRVEILQHIDQRIALSQQEKTCVQTAQSDIEFRACREKYRPARKEDHRAGNRQQ